MAPGVLRKKNKPEEVPVAASVPTRSGTVRQHGQPGPSAMRPDFRPVAMSIVDQEWVHQVFFVMRRLIVRDFFLFTDALVQIRSSTAKLSCNTITILSHPRPSQSQVLGDRTF